MQFLVLVRGKFVFSFYYNFIWTVVYTIYFLRFGHLSLTYELHAWVFLIINFS